MFPALRNKIAALKDRAAMLAAARSFFHERGLLEVDCPILSACASVDAHIDLIHTSGGRYLHSSPEYGMKRLLSEGIGDIYQLSHVFRDEERGKQHNPEFMMAEWYRLSMSFQGMIEETLDFIRLFVGDVPKRQMSYSQAFQTYAGIDPATTSQARLLRYIAEEDIDTYHGIENEGTDALLNSILAAKVEPCLGKEALFVLTHYPASQAALAKKTVVDGVEAAERFEVYFRGKELANGYHELCNAEEQRARLDDANAARVLLGKESLPIDEHFLAALERGLPSCCGVAVGFDRLMMLRRNIEDIADVIPFSWDQA